MANTLPDYWPLLIAYHQAREPLYRAIVRELALPPDARILDAGCADAFYSQLLASELGPRAFIVAVDHNLAPLRAARPMAPNVQRCQGDLAALGLRRGTFDAVWLCRTMHSAHDPPAWLRSLVPLLRPGGKLIVVENDLAHSPMMSMPVLLEQRVRRAFYRYEAARSAHGAAIERYHAARFLPAWLQQIGLQSVSLKTYVSQDSVPLEPTVEAYWRLWLEWQARCVQPFLSARDWAAYRRAFDPASPHGLLSRPGFYCLELTAVACGQRPV